MAIFSEIAFFYSLVRPSIRCFNILEAEVQIMVLQDHFRPPLSMRRHWHAFHNAWATYISSELNQQLPEGYFAEAIAQVTEALGHWLAAAKVIRVTVPGEESGNPWLHAFGRSATDPDFPEFLEELQHLRTLDTSA